MIIHVVTQEEPGGAQRLAVRLCRAHRAAGVAAETWFLYRKHAAFAGEPGMRTLLPERPTLAALPGLLARLRGDLAAAAPTAVVAHTHWSNLLVPAAARAAGVGRRIAVLHSPAGNLPCASRLAERLAALRGAATATVAIAPCVARDCPARVRPMVIPNATETRAPGDGPAARRRLGLAVGVPLAVAVGRLSAEKNHADLVAVLAARPDLHLAIAGDGPLRQAVVQRAAAIGVAGRLHLLGACTAGEVGDLLAAADVFAMPSRFEGLSLALLEAMQAGVPVVASAIAGNQDALGEGPDAAGLLVPVGDRAALAAAISRVIDEPALAARLRAAVQRRAGLFGEETMIAAWHRLLGVGAA